jgi:hypothetical protein
MGWWWAGLLDSGRMDGLPLENIYKADKPDRNGIEFFPCGQQRSLLSSSLVLISSPHRKT